MAASVQEEGVLVDTFDDFLAELNAAFQAEFGSGPNGISLGPDSYTGRQNSILAGRFVSLEQLIADVANILNLNNAQARQLDFIGTLLDEDRLPARRATISAICYGTPGFNVGDRRVRYVRNSTVWRVPLGTLIEANGQVAVSLVADTAGTELSDGTPIEAFADGTDQWVIVDTDSNFTAVESTSDSASGEPVESDPDYRIRLRGAGRSSGVGTEPGIRRAIRRVGGVTADIDNNRSLVANANGVPGKTIEVLTELGTDDDIAQVIFDSYGPLASFFGTNATGTATDEYGNTYVIPFTRIARIDIVWEVAIVTTGAETALPDDAPSLVQTALSDYTNGLARGLDVQPDEGEAAVRSALPNGSVPDGGLTVELAIKGSAVAGFPIVITSRQRARTNAEPQEAFVTGSNTQPFNIIAGQILQLAVDGGTAQNVTFLVTDFAVISAATAQELATAINNRTTGISAGSDNGALVIRSETQGGGSSINIGVGSSAALLTTLGLSFGTTSGSDGDITVTIT